jgi:hypothetical protein
MASTREERAPEADKIAAKDKSTISTDSRNVLIKAGPTGARSAWLKPLDCYERQQRCEFQVARFG